MPLEIERRFLVQGEEWKEFAGPGIELKQCYLSHKQEGWTVRIRISEEKKAWITLKSKAKEIANHEFEYLVPITDAKEIWDLVPHRVIKTRYSLKLKGGDWVVDCFQGENAPLVLAEVELSNPQDKIAKPSWCWKEITSEHHWSNAALAKEPLSCWPIEKRFKYNL